MTVENDQPAVDPSTGSTPSVPPPSPTPTSVTPSTPTERPEVPARPWMAPAAAEPAVVDVPEGLPTMTDLRAVSVDLDEIDEVLARLDAQPDDDEADDGSHTGQPGDHRPDADRSDAHPDPDARRDRSSIR